MYNVELSRQSQKDLVNLKQAGLLMAARELVEIIKKTPFRPHRLLRNSLETWQ